MSKVIKLKIEEVEEAKVVYLLTSNEGGSFFYM